MAMFSQHMSDRIQDHVLTMYDELEEALTAPADSPYSVGPATTKQGVRYDRAFRKTPRNLLAYYQKNFGRWADREFIVYEHQRYTFRQVWALANALAHCLQSKFGITSESVVAISMVNRPEWCIAFLAVTMIGAVALPINSLMKAAEYRWPLKDSGASLLICDEARYTVAAAACGELGVRCITTGNTNFSNFYLGTSDMCVWGFEALVAAHAGLQPHLEHEAEADDPAVIMYTSGSSGNPKGVLITHRAINEQMLACELQAELDAAVDAKVSDLYGSLVHHDRVSDCYKDTQQLKGKGHNQGLSLPLSTLQASIMLTVPLFHVSGLCHTFLFSIAIGRKLSVMAKWVPKEALRLIEKEKVTAFMGVPTMVKDLLECPELDEYDVSSVRSIGGGGAAMDKRSAADVPRRFVNGSAFQSYGLTETTGAVTVVSGLLYYARPQSAGRPNAVTQVVCRDEKGQDVPQGGVGEVWVKTPQNMMAYHNNRAKTAETFDRDGWMATGDIGRIDDKGFVYLVDRKKSLIIRGGENISPLEVEAAFLESAEVSECACIALPDDRLGEVPAIVLVTTSEGSKVTAQQLWGRVAGSIAKFKVPKLEHIVLRTEQLPRAPTGKIDKKMITKDMRVRFTRAAL